MIVLRTLLWTIYFHPTRIVNNSHPSYLAVCSSGKIYFLVYLCEYYKASQYYFDFILSGCFCQALKKALILYCICTTSFTSLLALCSDINDIHYEWTEVVGANVISSASISPGSPITRRTTGPEFREDPTCSSALR